MAYDSPGFPTPLPGLPDFQSHDSGLTAPGSVPPAAGIDAGVGGVEQNTGTRVMVTIPGGSLVNADETWVGAGDTTLPSQVQAYGASPDPLTGVGPELGATGAGRGSVSSPRHPDNVTVPPLMAQAEAARRPG
jgi:hypothetical protein